MPTVPLQGSLETQPDSSPDASPKSDFLLSLSLVISASKAECFSPEREVNQTRFSYYTDDTMGQKSINKYFFWLAD